MAATSERLRYPCAFGAPNGLSRRARSTSTWIHCRSPVQAANASMRSWPTATHSDAPRSRPTNCGAVAIQYCGWRLVMAVLALWQSAQILAQDLAHVRLRQCVEEADLLRHLVGRKLAPAVRDEIGFGERRARRLGHEQPHRLAGLLVGPADAGAFGHPGAAGGDRLDLIGKNVEARDDDHVLLAIDDLEETLGVEHADVAGAEIAVGREGIGIGPRIPPVALHHLRALGAHLARLADRRFRVAGVEQLDVGRRERDAYRCREAPAGCRIEREDRRCLREAVTFQDVPAGERLPLRRCRR